MNYEIHFSIFKTKKIYENAISYYYSVLYRKFNIDIIAITLDAIAPLLDIRLSGGASPNNGAVELHIGGSWFPVCGDIWDINAGSVACRHLGYPAALNVSGGDRKLFSKEKLWVTVLRCGNESSLNHCYKQSISRSKCGKVANVRCETGQ